MILDDLQRGTLRDETTILWHNLAVPKTAKQNRKAVTAKMERQDNLVFCKVSERKIMD